MILSSRSKNVEITVDLQKALQLRWPKKAVPDELLKMALWLTRYPAKRPVHVWRFVDNWLKRSPDVRQPAPVLVAWWTTDERVIQQGAAVGLSARPGETMSHFRNRISDKLRDAA